MDDDAPPRGPFRTERPFTLASASPRRQYLLMQLGIHFYVQPCPDPEPPPRPKETPADYVLRSSLFKAQKVAKQRPDRPVLGADTIVVLDKKILGKPQNAQDALGTLLELSNKEHQVLTGCTLIDPDTPDPHSFTALSRVYIGPQPLNVLQAYVESGEPLDKAGSYAIQGVGSFLVESITGSFSNVVGLPLSELTKLLQKTGVIAPLSSSHGHRTRPKTGHDVPAWS